MCYTKLLKYQVYYYHHIVTKHIFKGIQAFGDQRRKGVVAVRRSRRSRRRRHLEVHCGRQHMETG